jgi:hypothetical protein
MQNLYMFSSSVRGRATTNIMGKPDCFKSACRRIFNNWVVGIAIITASFLKIYNYT